MSDALLPVLLAAAVLLAASGGAKLRSPAAATAALQELGLPRARALVLAGALCELAVAAAVVVRPQPGAAAASALYLLFALLVGLQLRRGSTRSCGCLGAADTPPSRVHLALDLTLAAACACCVAATPHPLPDLEGHPFHAALLVLAAGTTAWLVAAGLAHVPRALGAYRRPAA